MNVRENNEFNEQQQFNFTFNLSLALFPVQIREAMGAVTAGPGADYGVAERSLRASRCDRVRRVHVAAHRPDRDAWHVDSHDHDIYVRRREDTVSILIKNFLG